MVLLPAIRQKLEAVEMKIFGDYEEKENGKEYLIVHFSPTSVPLRHRWRNTGLSADFLAEYWVTFFPQGDALSRNRQIEVKGAIRYIANELLENLMKFSYEAANYPVCLALHLYQDQFNFYASNAIDPITVESFQARIQELLTKDIDTLYRRQLEQNVATEEPYESHLGLLTIAHDYDARLAWKFETIKHEHADVIVVTTMVQLDI
jgi:hypothetical protein